MLDEKEICLGLDTALEACSVGLSILDQGNLTSFARSLDLGRGHAEHLMGELDALLAEAELDYSDLTRLAVTVGPGSFTGLRVGLATARSLALALDIPLIGCSTLEALALTAKASGQTGPLACLIDARRNQIYGQLFQLTENGSGVDMLTEASAKSARDFAAECAAYPSIAFTGSGSALVLENSQLSGSVKSLAYSAPDMASLTRWALDQPAPVSPPSPLYLRAPDAKPQASKAIERQSA